MLQKGDIIICGDAGEALGDSMYEGRIFVGGEIASLGNDAIFEELTETDCSFLESTLDRAGLHPPCVSKPSPTQLPTPNSQPPPFKKIVSGKQLYNFDRRHFDRWKHAL
jgi:methylamine---glutamate N-methyltransferase subunit B